MSPSNYKTTGLELAKWPKMFFLRKLIPTKSNLFYSMPLFGKNDTNTGNYTTICFVGMLVQSFTSI